jgi:succinate dehydrogenase hydrophobic anchor subunit
MDSTQVVQAGSNNWLFVFATSILTAVLMYLVNRFTTTWNAKHEYRAHAQKVFFEKKLEIYKLLLEQLTSVNEVHVWMITAQIENDQGKLNNLSSRLTEIGRAHV